MKNILMTVCAACLALAMPGVASTAPVMALNLTQYQAQGAGQANHANGKSLWYRSNNGRSCTSCHGDSPSDQGQHAKTRKPIEPMAPSANPDRYKDPKKVEKWFLRNCKWTYGRACTPQEKSDILSWLASQ